MRDEHEPLTLSHLDHFYLSGPATPMSQSEKDEYEAWKIDYARRCKAGSERQGYVQSGAHLGVRGDE